MDILVTNKDTGPEGWDVIPLFDENVFFNPNTTDEVAVIEMVELAKNGNLELLKKAATYDLPTTFLEKNF
jgi:hypothetical protein